ncbi:MAG: molybdopterin molybdotransferase MoeA [Betaproteobacteria bacterium]|nr:molybdopterin molybdotransferase MoeA [Betaproteobacteria bacterium]
MQAHDHALIDVDAALQVLLQAAHPLRHVDSVDTLGALGRVLAAEVRSPIDVPPAANTQMDGYAVRSADVTSFPTRLRVSQRIAAGRLGQPLQPGEAARIFTGAFMPDGADAVVMQEQCVADGDTVTLQHAPKPGEWVRPRGCDVQAGSVVLERGHRLRPQDLGQAASVGAATLQVAPRPRVALLSTGDELIMPGEPLPPGAIYNSNRFLLSGLLQGLGCAVTDFGQVSDRLDATQDALRLAAAEHDLILTSGGVSVGGEDHVKPAVQASGQLTLWQIAMKPGKPLAFGGVRRPSGGSAHFIGLPGNPVSSFVTFLLFVRPFLLALQGAKQLAPRGLSLPSASAWPRADKRREFLRARLDADGQVALYPNQNSAVLTSTVWGDGLVDNPAGMTFKVGDPVRFIPFAELLL